MGLDRITVAIAAKRLDITESAVRKRIERGQLAHDRDDNGRVWVYLGPDMTESATVSDPVRDEVIDVLRDQVRFLRAELERKDAILMQVVQRMPELEAPEKPSESPLSASGGPPAATPEDRKRGRKPFWAFWVKD
jgi:hypothetical protein